MANFAMQAEDWWGSGWVALPAQGPEDIGQETFYRTWPILPLAGVLEVVCLVVRLELWWEH